MESTVKLTEKQINKILDYLGKQPFKDVYEIIFMIQNEWDSQNTKKQE